MALVKFFNQLSKNDVSIAGGKGASLGEMTRAGIPVPPGFVILSAAFERFLKETDLDVEVDSILHAVNHKEIHTVEGASEKIKALILEEEMPKDIADEIQEFFKQLGTKYVAVRSSATAEDSATAAWAGQLESYLNTTEGNLLENVKKCWASLFTPRAIFYRFEKGLHGQHISVAVVVQKMVESEVSGIAFSVHPVTEDRNQLIIEAGLGLGEAIVSGQITPDSYVVEKNSIDGEPGRTTRRIIDKNISTQKRGLFRAAAGGNEWRDIPSEQGEAQVLSEDEILKLSELIIRIEKHYGFPVDVEWALEKKKFYIVQSRPITTLAEKIDLKIQNKDDELIQKIQKTNWRIGWSGPFPLLEVSTTSRGVYFSALKEIFGVSFTHYLITYKDGIAFARLPEDEYESIGAHLAEKAADPDFLKFWVSGFKRTFEKIIKVVNHSPNKFLHDFALSKELHALYARYGAFSEATKIVFDFLLASQKDAGRKLEDARKYTERFYGDNAEAVRRMVSALARSTGYTEELLIMMTADELIAYLKEKQLPSKKNLLDRKSSCAAYFTQKELHLLPASQIDVDSSHVEERPSELKGTVAYPGRADGRCRIVFDYKNAKLEEGEILITGMTDPHFVPLLKKAIAIVTDGGGMLCHAAIVSRELRKPCIIGTKIATKVLKDGDLIEVDADKGVVRILESWPITTPAEEPQQTFIKAYTRNFSIIMQQAWFAANKENLIPKLGLLEYPYGPPYIYFMKDGVEEVWENTKANHWLLEKLVEKFKSDSKFFPELYERYFERLSEVEKLWKKEITNEEDLKKFIDLVYEGISDFVVIYGALMDDDVPSEIKELAENFREKDVFFAECNSAIWRGLKNVYPEFGYLAVYITRDELGKKIDGDELKRRDTGFALIPGIFQGTVSFNELVKKFPEYRFEIEKGEQDKNGLIGQIAYRGKVVGRVRIVKRTDQAESVTDGEIIVSPMTTPDFVPAMKRASAFVTDEGGITCHAAIIAREMKKPCIIGTKIATSVVKTGDLVEVDADKGVVRILERSAAQDVFELEFSRETDVNAYYAWLDGYLEVCRILNIDSRLPEKTFALYKNGIVKCYTQKDNARIMKEAITAFDRSDLEQLINDYLGDFNKLKDGENPNRDFVKNLIAKFIIIFTLGDIAEHPLRQKALDARKKTEDLFLILPSKEIYQKSIDDKKQHILLRDTIIPTEDEAAFGEFLTENNSNIEPVVAGILANIFSREKSLLYFCVWNESDGKGIELIGEKIKNGLFIVPPKGEKGSVWYEKEELEYLKNKNLEAFANHKNNPAWETIKDLSKKTWVFLGPYARGEKVIEDVDEFEGYYNNLVNFWVCLNSFIYEILDNEKVDPAIRKLLAEFRDKTEKYTETMSTILTDYVEKQPQLKDTAYFVSKEEVLEVMRGKANSAKLIELKNRTHGCFMLNNIVYPLSELDTALRRSNLAFEKVGSDANEFGGTPAFGGVARGMVKIVSGFNDLSKIERGDILVTEMTNPKYLPAIEKALAIITNEGGMLCHAAITARELKKPCIIGTKIATKVLKDGDLVEVDADKGVVRVLEKKAN